MGRRGGAIAPNPTPFAIRSAFLETRAFPTVSIGCWFPRIPRISLIVIARVGLCGSAHEHSHGNIDFLKTLIQFVFDIFQKSILKIISLNLI